MPRLLATYRVQLRAEFGFDAAAGIADYLRELGVSHLYASPYLQAGKGSTHGYDVLDHTRTSDELGGATAHARLCQSLTEQGLGQVLDVVPNHMSIASRENVWWWDVLENGQSSRYAAYFDVDWQPLEAKLHNTVLLPILGDHYGRVVEAGEIVLKRTGGSFTFHYHDHVMPVAPRSLNDLLVQAARRAESDELEFIADSLENLPHATETDWASITRRHRDQDVLRNLLVRLCDEQPKVALAIDQVVEQINASSADLDVLLDRQNYRLAFWRTAGQELDYRRFFDINSLVSMRMELEQVFRDTHELVLQWVRQGALDGLRVDHPDGLRDPAQYFQRLHETAPETWIIAEKILEPGETLPDDWPVAGTTGYDFLNRLGGLLVDSSGEPAINDVYSRFTGLSVDYLSMVHEKKHLVLRQLFASDINRLTSLLVSICERRKRYRDYTRRELNAMIREVIACFPVYRTYARAETGEVGEHDVEYVNQAIESAKVHRPEIDADLIDLLRELLLLHVRGDLESEMVMRFQQHTGPVMAKGVEDTVFYNYNRLTALNEVGGDPGRFGLSIAQFHDECRVIQENWPRTMTTTTTHDTKRSEDVRARISLLAEIPEAWGEAVERWGAGNARHKRDGWPDRNIEYLLYQTLVGAWPIDEARVNAYLLKAAREAKAITSWNDPKPEYEESLSRFVGALYADAQFMGSLEGFVRPLIAPGRVNSLAQVLIKLTAPGIPDIYQGNELWDLSLVDPDNRRPVDYDVRRRLLGELQNLSPEEILARSDEGLPKLWVTRQSLALRARRPECFGPEGGYFPLIPGGTRGEHLIAFARGENCVAVAPRFPLRLQGRWEDTTLDLPRGHWRNEFTGESVGEGRNLAVELFRRFPVALLSREE